MEYGCIPHNDQWVRYYKPPLAYNPLFGRISTTNFSTRLLVQDDWVPFKPLPQLPAGPCLLDWVIMLGIQVSKYLPKEGTPGVGECNRLR